MLEAVDPNSFVVPGTKAVVDWSENKRRAHSDVAVMAEFDTVARVEPAVGKMPGVG